MSFLSPKKNPPAPSNPSYQKEERKTFHKHAEMRPSTLLLFSIISSSNILPALAVNYGPAFDCVWKKQRREAGFCCIENMLGWHSRAEMAAKCKRPLLPPSLPPPFPLYLSLSLSLSPFPRVVLTRKSCISFFSQTNRESERDHISLT
jgi:hypothetical protein